MKSIRCPVCNDSDGVCTCQLYDYKNKIEQLIKETKRLNDKLKFYMKENGRLKSQIEQLKIIFDEILCCNECEKKFNQALEEK